MVYSNRNKGFTLIELLVVIAIIAVLMGILMPALSKVRKQARGAACLSQIKQWSLMWDMYFNQNEGRMPDVEKGVGIAGGGWHRGFWVSVLRQGWDKRPELLSCPSAKKTNPDGSSHGGAQWTYHMPQYLDVEGGLDASYAMNLWACSIGRNITSLQNRPRKYHWMNVKNVKQAGEVPLFLDAMWRGGGPHWDNTNAITPPNENGEWQGAGHEMKHFAMDRHGGGVNVLFMDSSARKVAVKDLWGLNWHKDYPQARAKTMSASWWGPWLGKD
ncbi:MAG: type II secretion system protein [Phycisphaeraceae bacterium]|nr:type II secretion system protein [Phycisphaeraceae bacterium]